ncbi:MAG: hypothetical protein ABL928_08370 [Sphingorhabdus sp.]
MKRRIGNQYHRPLRGRSGAENVPSALPLVHATSVWCANEIVNQGKLVTNFCREFSKPLIYFFVLRPAYLRKGGDTPNHRVSAFPAAFIFSSQSVETPYHVYPFDTGAAVSGSFFDQANPDIPLDDYALDSNHAGVSNFISWAFGNLTDYYDGRLRSALVDEIKVHDFVGGSYLDIARMGVEGSNTHDKRASSLELTTDHNVDLPNYLKFVILPKQFVEENDVFLARLQSFGAEIEFYDWQPNRAPNEFQKDLMEIARSWYIKQGLDL